MPKINGQSVKREITEKRVKGDGLAAMLSGFVRSCLALVLANGERKLCLDCQSDFVREYISVGMMEQFKITAVEEKNSLYFADCEKLLVALKIFKSGDGYYETQNIDESFLSEQNAPYYVRGVFLGCGSLSVPSADSPELTKSGGYHLEFSFNNEDLADEFKALLGSCGAAAHIMTRAEKYVVYVKDSESVSNCLVLIGASKTALELNNAVAAYSVKMDVNRRINCDIANMTRTSDAAVGVSDAIDLIDSTRGMDTLPPKLVEAADARKNYPDAPLSFIAAQLGISKSGLKHRYDKIKEIAQDIIDGGA